MKRDEVQEPSLFAYLDEQARDQRALLQLFSYWPKLPHEAISLLVANFRPLATVFDTSEGELKQLFARHHHVDGFLSAVALADPERQRKAAAFAKRQQSYLENSGRGIVLMRSTPMFPAQLKDCLLPIDWLFCHPSLPVLPSPLVAIVGSRKSNRAQLAVAAEIAGIVVARGGAVITGLATGADVAAHRVAASSPRAAVAVLGTGIRKMFPKQHSSLVAELVGNGGAVLSELPPSSRGNAKSFILRNRIIAGLADLVVAVSGAYASGTAHTVRFAAGNKTPILSADPVAGSGITHLVEQLGGRGVTVDGLVELVHQYPVR